MWQYGEIEESSGLEPRGHVLEVVRIRALIAITSWSWLQTSIGQLQKQAIVKSTEWRGDLFIVTTSQTGAKKSRDSSPNLFFRVRTWSLGLNKWQKVCITETSWSRFVPTHHSSITFWNQSFLQDGFTSCQSWMEYLSWRKIPALAGTSFFFSQHGILREIPVSWGPFFQ